MNAVRTAAECDIAEVMLCMFGPTSDNYDLLHRGTRCRKMHSSYRSTFRTIGATPLATVSRYPNDERQPLHVPHRRLPQARQDPRAGHQSGVRGEGHDPVLLPELQPGHHRRPRRRWATAGMVIAGTGLGHVNKPLYPAIRRAIAEGHDRGDDRADALGLRPDVRLRHRPRPARPRHHPAGQHAARDGLHEARLGARARPTTRRGSAR